MLHRPHNDNVIVISQPAHAWISGQLGSAWGNPDLGLIPADPELRIAAEQHDIAWLDWEQRPTLNSMTGLPHAFNELPTLEHLDLWRTALPRALAYGRVPALLISMHGAYLYHRFHDFDRDSDLEAKTASHFLDSEEERQAELLRMIRASRDISQNHLETMRRLLSVWDAMSLAVCIGLDDSRSFQSIPSKVRDLDIRFAANTAQRDEYVVDPWPFLPQQVDLVCEGRRLSGRYEDEESMREALWRAEAVPLRFRLVPA